MLNVRHVLLVGPVAEFGDDWLAEVRRYARSSVLALLARDTQIEFGHVHDDVVVLGASALLMEQQLGLGVLGWRLAGAVLMLAAIGLVLV